MDTLGDIERTRPIEGGDGKALFTDSLEAALRRGSIDLCVHSLKDMPVEPPDDLCVAAYSRRADPRDALILPEGQAFTGFESLRDITAGCSSGRRRVQLLAAAPGIQTKEIRGNVPARIAKLDGGQYGALVLAMAGLERLGLAKRAGRIFGTDEMVPAAGQGILAVQARRGDAHGFLDAVNDAEAALAAQAELAVIRALEGGCSAPAAAYAEILGQEMRITGMLAEGVKVYKDVVSGHKERGLWLAETLAKRLKDGVSGVGG
jgi:porphobilinogen deaminase